MVVDEGLYGHKLDDYSYNEKEVFMSVIYKPSGKALEYCELALNIYRGCGHGCIYCYSPAVLRMKRNEFYDNPMPRKDIINNVKKEAHLYSGKKVLLCFTTDPYQPIEEKYGITRKTIQILVDNGVAPAILTKGGSLARRDFDLITEGKGEFATTLTFLDENKSKEYEPNASTPLDRVANLRAAKEMGIRTWVSLEPVIDPAETLRLIDHTYDLVDLFKVGKANYVPEAKSIDWSWFLIQVENKLKKYNKEYYIKKDLLEYKK